MSVTFDDHSGIVAGPRRDDQQPAMPPLSIKW